MPKPTLEAILAVTRDRVAALQGSAADLERRAAAAPAPRPFPGLPLAPTVGVIAEVKRRSPSKGAIRADLDPVAHARAYVRGGAVAVSVLTDEAHFGGSLDDLAAVAAAVPVPVLRKDFIVDELQLLEARAAGASAVLLIVRALAGARLVALARAARQQGLATLVEVHGEAELEAALAAAPTAIGVNARDLSTFAVDLKAAECVLARVPPELPAVAESGVEARRDVERLAAAGADLVLVGTSVARSSEPEAAVHVLVGVKRNPRRSA
jgi:indole-3-glycerol phosphate synthase